MNTVIKHKGQLVRLTLCGAMTALCIVFCRLLGFPQTGIWRVDFGFLPIAAVGLLYGPLWAGVSYGVADLIGAAIFTGVNPMITLQKALIGALMGAFFRGRERLGWVRILLSMALISVLLDFAAMTVIFRVYFGYTWGAALLARGVNAAVNFALRVPILLVCDRRLIPLLATKGARLMADFSSYANSFQATPRLGLARIRHLMGLLGNPQEQLSCIHVGGTNGKGSVVMLLDAILRHAGKRVGRYVSPNLVHVGERIAVNGTPVSDAALAALLARIEGAAGETERALGERVSQFEIWTAAAFLYFAEQRCDYVILEVGMGGEFDATNVISSCVTSVLTRISLDHTEYLGSTLTEIARTKCGIIKDACQTGTVVSAPQDPAVMEIIKEEAEKHGNSVIFADPPEPRRHFGMHESFFFEGYGDIRCGLCGVHQIENACVALTVAKLLHIDIYDAQCGVTYATHHGRLEVLREDPLLIYDGGHNPNGVEALLVSLDRYLGKDTPRACIVACMQDKDLPLMLKLLSQRPTVFFFTTVQNNPRAMTSEALTEAAAALGIKGIPCPTLEAAIAAATDTRLPTVILGSLYLYADLPETLCPLKGELP